MTQILLRKEYRGRIMTRELVYNKENGHEAVNSKELQRWNSKYIITNRQQREKGNQR
jgi:hypothetical protein